VGVFETRSKEPLIGSYEGGPKCNGRPVSPTPGKTWFLAGTSNGEKVKRTCTVPVATKLFFPVVSATFLITNPPQENKQVARAYVEDFIKAVVKDPDLSIKVKADGKDISDRIVRAKMDFFKSLQGDPPEEQYLRRMLRSKGW
jgi:hypothetical protein